MHCICTIKRSFEALLELLNMVPQDPVSQDVGCKRRNCFCSRHLEIQDTAVPHLKALKVPPSNKVACDYSQFIVCALDSYMKIFFSGKRWLIQKDFSTFA